MAGDWIKMRMDLTDDPAVVLIAKMTGIDRHGVVGRLQAIWSWADRHTCDGKIRGPGIDWLDQLVGTPGFAAAMIAAGWLKETTGGFTFPRFDRHNGQPSKSRALTALRNEKYRKRSRDGTAVTGASPEKRREEKKTEEKSTGRTSSIQNSVARTGGVGGDLARCACAGGDEAPPPLHPPYPPKGDQRPPWAPDARHYNRRLLRAVDLVNESAVSARRKPEVIEAVKVIASGKDPVPVVRKITDRAKGKVSSGGYIANAILEEAAA